MAGEIASAFVRIRPNMGGFRQETETGVRSSFSGVGKIIGGAFAAVGAIKIGKSLFAELEDSQKIAAQSAAVIKSTGGAANVTAAQIDTLSNSLLKKSGIDDNVIATGANMLLTFTSIRNEVGKGNDIFNQATATLTDMSAALGQDMKSSAIQLGKALNDPVKGMTALQRVGVSFTEQQKAQVAQMVKSHDTIGAQRLILHELNKEFGGSAEAAGKTLPGQISILTNEFSNLGAAALQGVMPALQEITQFLIDNLPAAFDVAKAVIGGVVDAVQGIAGAIGPALEPTIAIIGSIASEFGKLVAAFQAGGITGALDKLKGQFSDLSGPVAILVGAVAGIAAAFAVGTAAISAWAAATRIAAAVQLAFNASMLANPIGIAVVAIAALAGALVVLYTRSETARRIMDAAWAGIRETAVTAFRVIQAAIEAFVGVATALWQRFGGAITTIARTAFETVVGVIRGYVAIFTGIFNLIGDAIHGRWGQVWDDVKQIISGALGVIGSLLRGAVTILGAAAGAIGTAILDGIRSGLTQVADLVGRGLASIHDKLTQLANNALGWARQIGVSIIHGIIAGLDDAKDALLAKAGDIVGSVKRRLEFWRSPPSEYGFWLGSQVSRGMGDGMLSARDILRNAGMQIVNAAKDGAKAAATGAGGLGSVGAMIVDQARKWGIDAKAAMAVAMTEGGLKFGAVGDKGTSFGPFQEHIGGALGNMDPTRAAAFANSIDGISFALRKMADAGAAGLTGAAAIKAIVEGFERPADPAGEIRKAMGYYATVPDQVRTLAAQVPALTFKAGVDTVSGWLTGSAELPTRIPQVIRDALEKGRQEIDAARGRFSTAFDGLTSAADAALSAQFAAFKTPSERLLEKMQREDAAGQLKRQLDSTKGALLQAAQEWQDAGVALEAARAAAAAGPATVDKEGKPISPEDQAAERKKLGGDVVSAEGDLKAKAFAKQQALVAYNDAERAIKEAHLAADAARERKHQNDMDELKKLNFDGALATLQRQLARQGAAHDTAQKKIIALYKSYGIDYETSGKNLGLAIARGLDDSLTSVAAAAARVAKVIADHLKVQSPTRVGPMSDLDSWWTRLPGTLLSGVRPGAFNQALNDMLRLDRVSPSGGALDGGAGGGGGALPVLGEILGELRSQSGYLRDGKTIAVHVPAQPGTNQLALEVAR